MLICSWSLTAVTLRAALALHIVLGIWMHTYFEAFRLQAIQALNVSSTTSASSAAAASTGSAFL